MTKEDLLNILEIEENARKSYVQIVYDAVKNVSKTCGELEININRLSTQLKWDKPELAHMLTRELSRKNRKECSKMPLR